MRITRQAANVLRAGSCALIFLAMVLALRVDARSLIGAIGDFRVEVPETVAMPKIRLGQPSWAGPVISVQLDVENFGLTDICVEQHEGTLQGHVHVFVNGEKHAKLTTPQLWLDNLPPGEHLIEVYLNSSIDHRFFAHQGQLIRDSFRLKLSEPEI